MNIWRQWWVREVVVITDATLRSEKGWQAGRRTRRLRSFYTNYKGKQVAKKIKRSHNASCYYYTRFNSSMVQSCKVNDLCFRAIDVKQQSTHTVWRLPPLPWQTPETGFQNSQVQYNFLSSLIVLRETF